jgi:putative two-component system response regulator
MREHTVNGTFILASYPEPMAKEIALSHQSGGTGTGYPFKARGRDDPARGEDRDHRRRLRRRLRMRRTYKSEYTHEEAVKKILAERASSSTPFSYRSSRNSREFAEVLGFVAG